MPSKDWKQYVEDTSFEIIVRIVTHRGKLTRFAVILIHEGEDITRFDNVHGVPHRDVLGRENAFLKKEWYETMDAAEALDYAINDLSKNCQRYLDFYNSH